MCAHSITLSQENNRRLRSVGARPAGKKNKAAGHGKATGQNGAPSDEAAGHNEATGHNGATSDDNDGEEEWQWGEDESVTEESDDEARQDPETTAATHVLKMLYKGNLQEVNRREEQQRKGKVFNQKHDCYRRTRCTGRAQEESSAIPGGVINQHEDSSDDEDYVGDQKEVASEMQALRAVQQWVNQDGWDAAAEGKATTKTGETVDLKKDVRMSWEDVRREFEKGTSAHQQESGGGLDEKVVHSDYALDNLDPTQRVFAERVIKWAQQVIRVYKKVAKTGRPQRLPKLRSWLCGSAGSGKSTTLKTIVQHVRLEFQKEAVPATVELTAYTGVAAFNIGFGAKTSSSSFQIFPNASWKKELDGASLRRLEEQWESVQLLIVDEVSFIGRAFFARMHFRLQQAKRGFFAEANIDPNRCLFGDISIILVGDFGQLEPIDDWSMCDDSATWQTCPKKLKHLWAHQKWGRMLHGEDNEGELFNEAIVLNNIHRSKDDLWWTQSCLRLRDFECTKEGDWDVWRLHDLDRGHFAEEQKKYFEEEALWLCARCEDVGTRNGQKLAHIAEHEQKLVHRIEALHSRKNAKHLSASAFEGLRAVINLVRGCKVVLTRNVAYRYGLANGTRGTLVGVVYGPGGVGTFPEAIVVDVPDYTGPSFYGDDKDDSPTRRWVPLLPMVSRKEGTRMTREQFPVVAGFALTVNKAQGLTVKEGVVINLAGGRTYRPAAKHGLPFVAWTRSESFAMTAFKNLPSWTDFQHGRDSDMLQMRLRFTQRLQQLHRRTMAKYSTNMKTSDDEARVNNAWKEQRAASPKKQKHEPCRLPCPACDAWTGNWSAP